MKIKEILNDMHEENIDSMIILKPENIVYTTGFIPSNSSILILKDEPVLFVTKMDMEDASKNSAVHIEELRSLHKIKEFIKGRVGIENSMTVSTYKKLFNHFEVEITDIIERSRRIKSKEEIKNIKKAVDIAESSIKNLKLSERECEVAAIIDYNMRINGSEKPAFETIVTSGSRSSMPHAKTSTNPLENPILIDWGAVYKGYCSDITRTIPETEKQKEILDIVLEAQKAAVDVIKPGIKASYVDKVAREVIEEYGYGNSFIHSTGHGLGLEVHESPSLSRKEKIKIEKGMVITVEPGIYIEGEFGVRMEDVILIKNRTKVLSSVKGKSIGRI